MSSFSTARIARLAAVMSLLAMVLAFPAGGQGNASCTQDDMPAQSSQIVKSAPLQTGGRSKPRYLWPYNLHLTSGATSAEPLVMKDGDGNILDGTISLFGYDESLISIDEDGYVTALRPEGTYEIGTWIQATFDGYPVSNTCIVRVLSQDYGLTFAEIKGEHTELYYPESINGEDMTTYVIQFEIPVVDEYAYVIEARFMGLMPFDSARQILEIDIGESEETRVCGISGNPLRLGWNIEGNEWQNCFLVPFIPPRSPQWFIFYHEMGHNFTWPSYTFGQGLGPIVTYSEGFASAIAVEAIRIILDSPSVYPLGADAINSMQFVYDMNTGNFENDFDNWLASGADFSSFDANIMDGMWLHYRYLHPSTFANRFFLPLQPAYLAETFPIVDSVHLYGANAMHTFFAALMSAAYGSDLSQVFKDDYHFPLIQSFYDYTYGILLSIVGPQQYICGDSDGSGSVDIDDIMFIISYVFLGGPVPAPLEMSDVNCLEEVDIDDVMYLIGYVFLGGPEPCAECE